MKLAIFTSLILFYSYGVFAQCPASIASLGQGNGMQVCWLSGEAPLVLDTITYDNVKYFGRFVNGGSGDCWRTSEAATFGVNGNHQIEFRQFGTNIVCNVKDGVVDPNPVSLSVKFEYFRLQKLNGTVSVLWKTSEEENNDFFIVERSRDGIAFEQIALVPGKGFGTTYSFSDPEVANFSGIYYYRLRQVDFDGTEFITSIQAIEIKSSTNSAFSVYPNPVNDNLFLKLDYSGSSEIQIVVNNVWGQTVIEKKFYSDQSNNLITLSVEHLSGGYYFINLNASGFFKNQKFLKE